MLPHLCSLSRRQITSFDPHLPELFSGYIDRTHQQQLQVCNATTIVSCCQLSSGENAGRYNLHGIHHLQTGKTFYHPLSPTKFYHMAGKGASGKECDNHQCCFSYQRTQAGFRSDTVPACGQAEAEKLQYSNHVGKRNPQAAKRHASCAGRCPGLHH